MTLYQNIKLIIEGFLEDGIKSFIIYPFGEVGMIVRDIITDCYNINDIMICDNKLSRFNDKIFSISILDEIDCANLGFIFSSNDFSIYEDYKQIIENKFAENRVKYIFNHKEEKRITDVGRHSYGPIARNHRLIKKIGNFCSFAEGVDVVVNHSMEYVTTSPFIEGGQGYEVLDYDYDFQKNEPWFIADVRPREIIRHKRIEIGNDVWLGRNVTITNYSNIGNGVIAGAGAVITKDIPDYAIVVGVPARIVKYRFSKEIIMALNKIAWWNWTDEEIKERFEDFYLDAESFVKKYL